MSGTRYGHKIRGRLNGGWDKANKRKYKKIVDLHDHFLPTEIGYEDLSNHFLCSIPIVKCYIKISGLTPLRKIRGRAAAFDRIITIEALTKYSADGKLTFDKKRLLAAGANTKGPGIF